MQLSYQDTFKRINKVAHSMKVLCNVSHLTPRPVNTDTPASLILQEPAIPSFLTSPECPPAVSSAVIDAFVRSAHQIRIMYETKHRNMASRLAFDPNSSRLECHDSFFKHRYQDQLLVLEQLAVGRARQLQQSMQPALRTKPSFNQEFVPLFETYFEYNAYPSAPDRAALAKKSMMTPRQIEVWFQNHRNRAKKEGKNLRRLTSDALPLKLSLESLEQKMPFFFVPEHQRKVPFIDDSSEQDLSGDSEEEDQVARSGMTNRDTYPVFSCEPPPHAFPTLYPPSCDCDPFPREARRHTFQAPVWRRKPATSFPLSTSIDFEIFTADFASKLVLREGPVNKNQRSSSHNTPGKPWFSSTHVIVPPAPHPALIRSVTSPHGPSASTSPISPPHLSDLSRTSIPPYIQPAYSWLLNNLHNPYPSKHIRAAISLETKSDRKHIDSWFVDARKRMGWKTLAKKHFSNKRTDIIDAATRFFVQEDSKRPLDPNLELEFAAIETSAKDLYSDKFSETLLAAKLDVAVKDMTPEMKTQARENEKRRRQEEKVEQAERSMRDVSAYPSPDRSSNCTPEPSLLSPSPSASDEASRAPSEPPARNKRRLSSVSPDDIEAVHHPSKRYQLDAPSNTADITPVALPSPAPSFYGSHESSPPATSNSLSVACISNRKRRLSVTDLETSHTSKLPCNLPVWPRLHTVSDPLPLSAIDDWFHNNFGIPNAVTVEAPDESVPVEVDIFDYSTLNGGALYEVFDSPTGSVERSVDHTVPPAVEPPTSNQIPSYALEISTNDFNYDELFCDPEVATPDLRGGNLPLPPSLPMPSSTNFALNPFDLNSFPSTVFPDPTDDTAAIADLSAPVFQNPASNLQWNFPSIISPQHLLGPMDEFQNPGLNFFTQDDSFMFDPSMMSIYSSCLPGESVLPLPITADKAEKQRKLLEMKEATRLLEAEIAAS